MFGRYYPLLRDEQYEFFGDDIHNITDQCPHGEPWILTHFGQCVSNAPQWASFVIGFISLIIWFFPGIPQIYQNYKKGSCDEALSPIFLFLWVVGDSMNLTGAILTKQLPVQIYVGGYYIIQDCVIWSQFIYYKLKNRWRASLEQDLGTSTGVRRANPALNGVLLGGMMMMVGGASFYSKMTNPFIESSPPIAAEETYRSRTLLMAPIFNGATDEIGYACGIISSISYLSGRIPQLIKNHRRRSTEGVSILMYILICLGNSTYGVSVLLGCEGDPLTYYARHLPWLVGSLACLLLDSFVFVQYYRFRDLREKEDLMPIIDDSLERSNEDEGIRHPLA